MNTDPKILDHERRLAQLESAKVGLDAALNKLKDNLPPGQPPVPVPPPPAIVVEETKLASTMSEPEITKSTPSNSDSGGSVVERFAYVMMNGAIVPTQLAIRIVSDPQL